MSSRKRTDATVVIYPSDHFVYPEDAFLRRVERGMALARERQDRLVILGARPDGAETDYGWIQPGDRLPGSTDSRARGVAFFIEKPTRHAAEAAFHRGALWSTSIVIGRVGTLWTLGWRYLPKMMPRFELLRNSLNKGYDESMLERIYRDMPRLDFSRNLLELAYQHVAVMELDDVVWSDWGSPQRIVSTLEHVGLRPSFGTNRRVNAVSQRREATVV